MTITEDRHGNADPRTLLPDEVFDRLVAGLITEHGWDQAYAERVMANALAFLVACALNPSLPLSPSQVVDHGWHEFYKPHHRADYTEFCQRIAGRFITHVPDEQPVEREQGLARLGATVEAMREAGLPVDPDLWITAANCSQCYSGCVDDPGKEA